MLKSNSVVAQQPKAASTGYALASLSLAMLLASLGTSIANVGLPAFAQAFDASFQAVQWVVLIYLLAMTTVSVSVGKLGDLVGRQCLLLIGLVLFTAASLLCALAPNLGLLILARAIQGVAAAILMALAVALVRETVPKERTGSAMGLLGTMSAIGTALGPSLGGVLIATCGWQALFLSMLPLGLVNIFLAKRYLPYQRQPARSEQPAYDFIGTLLLACALAAYALAMTLGQGQFDYFNLILLAVAVLAGSLFVLNEFKAAAPLIQLAAFRNKVFSASLAMNLLVSAVMMTTLVVGPFFLAYALGLNPALVGMTMAVGPVISALIGVPAGKLTDQLGTTCVLKLGIILMALASFALAVLPAYFGIWGYLAAIALLTPSYQLFQAANNTAVMLDISEDQRGVISGMLSLSRNLGLITGVAVMGALFAFVVGTSDFTSASAEALTRGMSWTFFAAGLFMSVALISLVVVHPKTNRLLASGK